MGSPVTLSSLAPPPTQQAPSASVPDGSLLSGISVIDPNLKTPYTGSWNAGIQARSRTLVDAPVNHGVRSSHRLLRSVDGNPPLPALVAAAQANGTLPTTVSGAALRFAPLIGLPQVTGNLAFEEPIIIKSIGNATYNALQTTFHKRFNNELVQAAYTWSRH